MDKKAVDDLGRERDILNKVIKNCNMGLFLLAVFVLAILEDINSFFYPAGAYGLLNFYVLQ